MHGRDELAVRSGADRAIAAARRGHPRSRFVSPEFPSMTALSPRLTSKRLYIADLAARLDAMESGRTPMNAVAYRLYARRLEAVVAKYPAELLAIQLGASHPAVTHAIEQQQFETDGMLVGRGSGRALVRAATLLRRLRHERP
jgi:hypothetical protein